MTIKKEPKKTEKQENVSYGGGLKIQWPLATNYANMADRHRTVGQVDTLMRVGVFGGLTDNGDIIVSTELIQRVQPEGKKTFCAHESAAIPALWARMLALACECQKGVDSMTARIAAVVYTNNYDNLNKNAKLDILFKERASLAIVIEFPSSKQTPAGWGATDTFPVFSTIGKVHADALLLAETTKMLDKHSQQKPRELTTRKASTARVDFELKF